MDWLMTIVILIMVHSLKQATLCLKVIEWVSKGDYEGIMYRTACYSGYVNSRLPIPFMIWVAITNEMLETVELFIKSLLSYCRTANGCLDIVSGRIKGLHWLSTHLGFYALHWMPCIEVLCWISLFLMKF